MACHTIAGNRHRIVTADAVGACLLRVRSTHYHAWDPPPREEPRFVPDEVDALVRLAGEHDRAWSRWFVDRTVEPLELLFDDLVTNPHEVAARVLEHLGLPDTPATLRTDPTPRSDSWERHRSR